MLGSKPAERSAPKAQAAEKPEPEAAKKADPDEDSAWALAEYNALMEKPPKTVAGHSKLAAWCEEHGLRTEADVHWSEVVRLDPRRESAWRKLGYRKVGRRWMTAAQIAEAEELRKAGRIWASRLNRIHKDLHGANGARRRREAEAALAAVDDDRAIPSLHREFGCSGQVDQMILIEALGRIDRRLSTQVLSMMAVYGRTPEIRRRAAENLRSRPSGDYIELLVGLMVDPLKYEVQRVGGPGLPGILLVEGEQFNIARYYAPPAPNINFGPGDIISFDASGLPVITRPSRTTYTPAHGVSGSKTLVTQTKTTEFDTYSLAPTFAEARRAAVSAEMQLENDIAQVKAINIARRRFNDILVSVASYATGKNHGETAKDWRNALAAANPSRKRLESPQEKPTVAEMVPRAYQPNFAPAISGVSIMKSTRTWVDT